MKKVFSSCYLVLALAFIYVPIFVLVIYSFTDSKIIGKWDGFSFELYEKLFTDEKLTKMIFGTLFLAVVAGLISTVLGTVGAIGIFYNKGWFGKTVKSASQINVINAEIVTAISLALTFALVGINRSYASLIIGHVALCTPFVVLSVLPKLKQMDGSLYEAALDLGATPGKALWQVVLPEIMPGVFSGFMLALTLSLDDYMITAYTRPYEFDTISTYVYSAVKNQRNSALPALRALTTIIVIIMIIVVIIMNIQASKKAENAKK
ncbi:MAG: ABC transporter permease [Clostridia bacterium]|nr:ABC transporter permease [Clostridia bacterium]